MGYDEVNDSLITPELTLRHWFGSEMPIALRAAVVTWGQRAFRAVEEHLDARSWPEWTYAGRNPLSVTDGGLAVLHAPVGSPGTVMMMEELRALGARSFVGFGLAGGLDPSLRPGDLVLPSSCVAEEGTSAHYGGTKNLEPSSTLAHGLRDAFASTKMDLIEGAVWTTDAPYRETVSKVTRYRDQKVLAVDMETSAMYAFGRFRNVHVCNLLAIADLLGDEWDPSALISGDDLQLRVNHAAEALVSSLASV
jgi:uridine phosphorylase